MHCMTNSSNSHRGPLRPVTAASVRVDMYEYDSGGPRKRSDLNWKTSHPTNPPPVLPDPSDSKEAKTE